MVSNLILIAVFFFTLFLLFFFIFFFLAHYNASAQIGNHTEICLHYATDEFLSNKYESEKSAVK